jgi:hypothetical protein
VVLPSSFRSYKKSFGRTFAGYIMADRKLSEEFRDEIITDRLSRD